MAHEAFTKKLVAAGGEVLAPTNPYEVLRFRTSHGVGVVYCNSRGKETWNREAQAAQAHLSTPGSGSLAPVATVKGKRRPGDAAALLARDGGLCFFCILPFLGDMTVEHLVPRAHGGPNHISNKFLAHHRCNSDAGHLSAPEKIAIHDRALRARWQAEWAEDEEAREEKAFRA